jgi:hypothetical protein
MEDAGARHRGPRRRRTTRTSPSRSCSEAEPPAGSSPAATDARGGAHRRRRRDGHEPWRPTSFPSHVPRPPPAAAPRPPPAAVAPHELPLPTSIGAPSPSSPPPAMAAAAKPWRPDPEQRKLAQRPRRAGRVEELAASGRRRRSRQAPLLSPFRLPARTNCRRVGPHCVSRSRYPGSLWIQRKRGTTRFCRRPSSPPLRHMFRQKSTASGWRGFSRTPVWVVIGPVGSIHLRWAKMKLLVLLLLLEAHSLHSTVHFSPNEFDYIYIY